MVVAFHSVSGRSHSARAALLTVHGCRAFDRPGKVVRAMLPGDPALPITTVRPDFLLIQREVPNAAEAVDFALGQIDPDTDGYAILDLPGGCLEDARLAAAADLRIVTVGSAPMDEIAAVTAASGSTVDGPVWFLGCDRAGGAAAVAALRRALSTALDPVRALPVTLGLATRNDLLALHAGHLDSGQILSAVTLWGAIAAAVADPDAAEVDLAPLPANFVSLLRRDYRGLHERLRALADELPAIQAGDRPDRDDLATAPLLEDWSEVRRDVPALAGRAYGHPDMPDGRLVTTSDVYERGPGWVRTISRYWRLGRRMDDGATTH